MKVKSHVQINVVCFPFHTEFVLFATIDFHRPIGPRKWREHRNSFSINDQTVDTIDMRKLI